MSRGRGGSSASLTALSTQTVTVNYFTADGTAIAKEDYVATQGVLTYAPGETLKKIVIEMPKDKKVEDIVEAFFVELVNASANAVILKRGVVHVVDDDVPSGNSGATVASASRIAAEARASTFWSRLPISVGGRDHGDADDDDDDDELDVLTARGIRI